MGSITTETPNYLALFAVQQNTPKIDAQIKTYADIGYVVDGLSHLRSTKFSQAAC